MLSRGELIELAGMLDAARLQASAGDELGVYASVNASLHTVLETLLKMEAHPVLEADRVFAYMVRDGDSVREALERWSEGRGLTEGDKVIDRYGERGVVVYAPIALGTWVKVKLESGMVVTGFVNELTKLD